MLKAILYGYMNNIYSCRKIEKALKRDVHFIWLAGYEQPDFNTINRFRNRVKDEINEVFTQLVVMLADKGYISLDVEYIDGTKIESKANKYTFVWRKRTESGYVAEKVRYRTQSCDGCPLRCRCFRSKGNRTIEVNHRLAKYRKQDAERLTSEEGIKYYCCPLKLF